MGTRKTQPEEQDEAIALPVETDGDNPIDSVVEKKISAAVDAWVSAELRNSDFSRDTAAWNVLRNALPALVKGIMKEVE